jgi:hypothetical protein
MALGRVSQTLNAFIGITGHGAHVDADTESGSAKEVTWGAAVWTVHDLLQGMFCVGTSRRLFIRSQYFSCQPRLVEHLL